MRAPYQRASDNYTILTRESLPCPRRDSNPQCQQASGRRPTPETAESLTSAVN